MNLKSFVRASLLAAVLGAIAAPSAIAGSFSTVRRISTNNIYQCNTGLAWEREVGASNVFSTFATFAMGCLNSDGTARWILQSGSGCQEGEECPANLMDYLSPEFDSGIYTRSLSDVRIGRNCEIEARSDGGRQWRCEDITFYDALTVETVGVAEIMSVGQFESRGGVVPEPDITISIVAE
ncbi:MAG: hypothetical protein ACFB9N_12770 [Geitlerinemataceae cyanobacterium]